MLSSRSVLTSEGRATLGTMIYITHIRLSSGSAGHEHITTFRWRNPQTDEAGVSNKAEMVKWVRGGGVARVRDSHGNEVGVGVVEADPPYLRTFADETWTDNLLSLPHF